MHHNVTWNRGFFLNLSPYLRKSQGIGHMIKAMKPSKLLPHPNPSFAYILGPARGSNAPPKDRSTVLAARAEAA